MPDYDYLNDILAPWDEKKINKVVIENGVTNIGNYAFCSLPITSITIPKSVKKIGEGAFQYCSALTSITIPNSVTSIGDWAFNGSGLTSIIIPNSITSIGWNTFSGCPSLTSVTIPNSVQNIGMFAFEGCSALTSVNIGNSVTSIDSYAFYRCPSLASITIPNSVKSIGKYAFYECLGLTSVIIGNSVTSIGHSAFYCCSSLISVTIGNSVTSIGDYAFEGCSDITSINIPASVTSIGFQAFFGCSSLKSISIPYSVTSIGDNAFCACSGLTSITVDEKNTKYDNRNNCNAIIEKESNTLIVGCRNTIISNSVTSIEGSAFYGCSNLASITIPESVTNIKYYAFAGCSNLSSIIVEKGNKKYDSRNDCNAIIEKESNTLIAGCMNTIIPNSVTSIGKGAFASCSNLTFIIIPNSVTSIGESAFENCSGLTSITCELETPPVCKDFVFDGVNESILVNVPANSIEAYKTAKEWKKFTNIQAIINNQSIANDVIEKIDAIGNVEYTDACKDKIDDACKAYEALTENQKALVTNLDVLTTAQQTYDNLKTAAEKLAADKAKADAVIAKITAIGNVEYTETCKGKIDAASTAYNALTADQKVLVTNLDVLTTAQQTYDNLKAAAEKLAADKAAANKVINKIKAIGTVEYTEACKKKIDAASTAYNALTADQKALVTNLDVLTTAKQTYETLKAAAEKLAADKDAANVVIAKINAIGKVEYTYACKDKIDEANNAYNALTADQNALVTNLDVLTIAKQTYDNLKAAADKLAADKAAFDKYKIEIIVIIESLVKEDDSDAVRAIINKAIIDIDALKYEEVISLDDNKEKVNTFVTSVNEAVENQRAEDQKTNGIDELELAEKVNIYDLNGRKITSSILKSGLYIRNGKKMVVK